jgi:hypothetical protein
MGKVSRGGRGGPPTRGSRFGGQAESFPSDGPHRLDPIIFVEFDQRISPSDVLETISVRANDARQRICLATSDEIASDGEVKRLSTAAGENRWLAFRATEPLPPDMEKTFARVGTRSTLQFRAQANFGL